MSALPPKADIGRRGMPDKAGKNRWFKGGKIPSLSEWALKSVKAPQTLNQRVVGSSPTAPANNLNDLEQDRGTAGDSRHVVGQGNIPMLIPTNWIVVKR
jgi:hypothetical protein